MPLTLEPDKKSGIYQIRGTVTVWTGGQPRSIEVRRSTRTRNRKEADAIRRQIEGEVSERSITGREPAITFEEAARLYQRKGGEARFLAKPLAHLGDHRIDEIGQPEIDDAALKAYPAAKPATVRRQFYAPTLAVLRANGQNPFVKRPDDSAKRTYFFLPAKADALIEAVVGGRWPNPWSPALVTFLFGQGARISEALAIDGRDDVSLEHRYVILRDPKNGLQRTVNLIPRVVAALSAIPNIGQPGPLFLRYDGRPYASRANSGNPLRFWGAACGRIGLDEHLYTPHTARHSWATWFHAQTHDVVRLKDEGGWQSNEWQRYVKLGTPELGADAWKRGWRFVNETGTDSADFLRKRG